MVTCKFAENCAWTAVYLSVRKRESEQYAYDRQFFHIGIDPTFAPGNYMQVFGGFFTGWKWGYIWRLKLRNPVPFSRARRHSWLMPVYRGFCNLQHKLDRRF